MKLLIPSLQICVPLYSEGNRQKIVDAPNSAILIKWNKLQVIADHNYQANFKNLNQAIPKKTMAFLYKDNRTEIYICDSIENGYIKILPQGNRLYTQNWNLVHEVIKDGLCIYTCRGYSVNGITNICLTHWVKR